MISHVDIIGIALSHTRCGLVNVQVDSRIIVDAQSYGQLECSLARSSTSIIPGFFSVIWLISGYLFYTKMFICLTKRIGKFNPAQVRSLKKLSSQVHTGNRLIYDDDDSNDSGDEYNAYDDSIFSRTQRVDTRIKKVEYEPLTKDQLMMCTPLVLGYALKTKKWLHFFVDTITDIEWSDDAFDSLVLPNEQKELILSFAESQNSSKATSMDDVVQGKGKGVIMLLSGYVAILRPSA